MERLVELEKKLKYTFKDSDRLLQALSHSSYAYESLIDHWGNERLEFLGDSVLDMVIGEILYRSLPHSPEGKLTKVRALIVCEPSLRDVADSLNLGDYLLLGKGEELTGGKSRTSNLANALEALIAAVYLDSSYKEVYSFIERLFKKTIAGALDGSLIYDYKSRLLEWSQSFSPIKQVDFILEKESGPDHSKTFYVNALVGTKVLGKGLGNSKKEAEQDASKKALINLDLID